MKHSEATLWKLAENRKWSRIGGCVFVTPAGSLVELRPAGETDWHLSLLVTPKEERGKGNARSALKEIIEQADASGITIILNAKPTRGCSMKAHQLIKWYLRNDFVMTAVPPAMTRCPNPK